MRLKGITLAALALGLALPAGARARVPGAPTVSPRYTITIPAARSPRAHVSAELDGIRSPAVTLAFVDRSGPGLEGAIPAYRITPRVTRRRGPATALRVSRRRAPGANATFVDVADPGGREPLGDLAVDYDLDLAHALPVSAPPEERVRAYQDRMVVAGDFATLRGDVLFVPTGMTIDRPRVKFAVPEAWSTVVNADRDGEWLVFPARYPPRTAMRALRWFGLSGKGLTIEERAIGPVRWSLAIAPTPVDVRTVSHVVWDRVRHYSTTFGLDALAYVALPPPLGAGRRALHLFAIPFPAGSGHASGGQYFPGTAYFFYSPDCPESLGHVVAHEYLHAYNCNALRHGEDGGPESVNDLWFREGYTEVQAALTSVGLDIASDAERAKAVQLAIAEAWALANGRPADEVQIELGLAPAVGDRRRAHVHLARPPAVPKAPAPALSPLGRLDGAALWQDHAAYDRMVEGRSRLVVFALALALERARPGRRGLDAWLKGLLAGHALARADGRDADAGAIHRACLEAGGASSAELEDLYQRYVLGTEAISMDRVRAWISDEAVTTLAPRIRCRGAASPAARDTGEIRRDHTR